MTSSAIEASTLRARAVSIGAHSFSVRLSDGRAIEVPLEWYPRLAHATERERQNWRLIAGGAGVHWDDLDEDIQVAGLLEGRRSAESDASLQKWLRERSRPVD
ncbi:MAG: DUF2442 domain-containing protein [Burkholderiaceae bacterium]|nr:DUF2442 domain-containing protein [Burkholderiaceae bacterium]